MVHRLASLVPVEASPGVQMVTSCHLSCLLIGPYCSVMGWASADDLQALQLMCVCPRKKGEACGPHSPRA